jgi:hypothetical protein
MGSESSRLQAHNLRSLTGHMYAKRHSDGVEGKVSHEPKAKVQKLQSGFHRVYSSFMLTFARTAHTRSSFITSFARSTLARVTTLVGRTKTARV